LRSAILFSLRVATELVEPLQHTILRRLADGELTIEEAALAASVLEKFH
jgi:hypothetical protein